MIHKCVLMTDSFIYAYLSNNIFFQGFVRRFWLYKQPSGETVRVLEFYDEDTML
jgi:hypothetical protein